ncbi:MAG: hypothetical protein EOP33_00440 [Rickettsiaceae bacterium]|nr:MAG: hypothetical protein EOP33_00440 [Rickettsiaceae bacterium]
MISVGILVVCTLSLCIGIYETGKKYWYDAKHPIPHKISPADAQSIAELVLQTLDKQHKDPLNHMEQGIRKDGDTVSISGSSELLVKHFADLQE